MWCGRALALELAHFNGSNYGSASWEALIESLDCSEPQCSHLKNGDSKA